MFKGRVDILMYHSISDDAGPTSIAPATFAAQMQALADSGIPVVTLDDLAGGRVDAAYAVVITFDDGFQDFADVAWPEMRKHGFRPIVYLPAALVGRQEDWTDCNDPPRPLMGWPEIQQLASEGVLFGSHSVSHANLDLLDDDALDAELSRSRDMLEARLRQPVPHFAPPYGAAGPRVRARIARHYDTSVGTRLGTARPGSDPYDLPRLEMFYFTNLDRWRSHLAGRGGAYLARRRVLRELRQAALGGFGKRPAARP